MGPDFATRSYSISLNVVLLSPLHRESPFSGKRNRCFEIEQTLGFEGQKSAYSTSNDEQEGNVLPGNQFLVCKIGFYVLRYTYEVNFKLAWFENRLFVYHGYANPRPDAEIAGAGEISWCPPVSRSAAPAYQRLTSVASAFFPRPTGLDDVVMSRRGKDVRTVAIYAKAGTGAFSRLVPAIMAAGLTPPVRIEPTVFVESILRRWGWCRLSAAACGDILSGRAGRVRRLPVTNPT
jgi:hypothetical protein